MQKSKLKRISEPAFLIVLIIVFLSLMLFFGNKKEGYHVDELYSYGLSNSEYLPFMHMGEMEYSVKDWMKEFGPGENLGDLFRNLSKDFKILKACGFHFKETEIYSKYLVAQANSADTTSTTWVTGTAYRDYLAASASNRFNYASVYYNQRGDVHPPLFYSLLHTICSFAPGVFTKWFGLGLNMVIGSLSLLVLYFMVKKHMGGIVPAIIISTSYVVSCGFITTALYIRMYMLLTLFTLLYISIHLDMAAAGFDVLKRKLVLLGLITVLGYLTHYYFVIFALGTAFVFVIWMIAGKKFKALLKYVVALAISAAVGICLWPFSIKHVFFGYRGQASIQTFSSGNISLIKVKLMCEHFRNHILGKGIWFFFAFLIIISIALIFIKKPRNIQWGKNLLVLFPSILYLCSVAQIVPYFEDRYVVNLYPLVILVFLVPVVALDSIIREKYVSKWKIPVASVVVVIALMLCNNCFTHEPNYLILGGTETFEVLPNTSCIFVLPDRDWNQSTPETNILAKCERVGIVYESNLMALKDDKEYTDDDNILVVIRNGLDSDALFEKVNEELFDSSLVETNREMMCGNTHIWAKVALP